MYRERLKMQVPRLPLASQIAETPIDLVTPAPASFPSPIEPTSRPRQNAAAEAPTAGVSLPGRGLTSYLDESPWDVPSAAEGMARAHLEEYRGASELDRRKEEADAARAAAATRDAEIAAVLARWAWCQLPTEGCVRSKEHCFLLCDLLGAVERAPARVFAQSQTLTCAGCGCKVWLGTLRAHSQGFALG